MTPKLPAMLGRRNAAPDVTSNVEAQRRLTRTTACGSARAAGSTVRCSDLLCRDLDILHLTARMRNRLSVLLQTVDMKLDGLTNACLEFLNGRPGGDAARQVRNVSRKSGTCLFDNYCVSHCALTSSIQLTCRCSAPYPLLHRLKAFLVRSLVRASPDACTTDDYLSLRRGSSRHAPTGGSGHEL